MTIKGTRRLLAAALCVLCIGGARAEQVPELLEPAGVQLASTQAVVGDISKITAYSGAVMPHVEKLGFAVDGEIEEIRAVIGGTVCAGDVLITLNREEQIEKCESLEEQIDALRSEDAYAQQLAAIDREILNLELDAILADPDSDPDAAALKRLDIEEFELKAALQGELRRMKLERLEAEYAGLIAQADESELTAPFDGRIMYMKDVSIGDRVGAYADLVYLADDTKKIIRTEYVSEAVMESAVDLYALVGGMKCEIEYVPMSTDEYLSMVLGGEELFSRFAFTDENAPVSVGEYAAVCIETGRVENALVIPRNALYAEMGVRYVYVVEDGMRVRREVETGMMNDLQAQITSGLEEGEYVYVQD